MAYTNANTRAANSPFSSVVAFCQSLLARAECFAAEADQEKKLHLLNSVSDETLSEMGLRREEIRAHVLSQ